MRVNQSGNNPVQSSETNSTQRAEQIEKARDAKKGKKAEAASSNEAVATTISARGKELAQAKAIANGTPDVREQKIAELKKRISEGKYKVDPDAVAERLVDEHLKSEGLG